MLSFSFGLISFKIIPAPVGTAHPKITDFLIGNPFGIIKHHIVEAGLFGVWTEKVSCGIDSDLWWKLYQYFQEYPLLQACYTSDIQTFDSCNKRWKTHINTFFRNYALKKLFNEIHGCKNYKSVNHNPSRNKSNWIIDLT